MSGLQAQPELLAPAGEWDSLRAAVANGADAVYFGLPRYSARARAKNFTLDELPEAMAFLRDRNVRGYVAFNTLIYSDELAESARHVEAIARAGADAVIVQDAGLLQLVRRMAPGLPVHASTQMTQTHPAGLRMLEEWGVSRVILARELSLERICAIRAASRLELEVFVHGALCISFSGQCHASSWLFGRSGNRGECAQACRLPYELLAGGASPRRKGVRYPLSPLDLCELDSVGDLVRMGVAGLKIEGRLKSADYVAAVTRAYREEIDRVVETAGVHGLHGLGRPAEAPAAGQGKFIQPPRPMQAATAARLAQGFSRGFTAGFLGGASHQSMVEGRSPKGRGLRVGVVAAIGARGIVVSLLRGEDVRPGDGVAFDCAASPAGEQGGRVYEVIPVRGQAAPRRVGRAGQAERLVFDPDASDRRAELTFGRVAVDMSAVAPGANVWKTDDPRIRRELEHSRSRDVIWRRRGLRVRVTASAGGPLLVHAEEMAAAPAYACPLGGEPLAAEARWAGPLDVSRKHPLTAGAIREQFSRLGGTPFELVEVELAGPDGPADAVNALAPKSVLNDLRREVVGRLRQRMAEAARRQIADIGAVDVLREHAAAGCEEPIAAPRPGGGAGESLSEKSSGQPRLSVLARTLEQAEAVVRFYGESGQSRIGVVWCDLPQEDARREAMAVVREAGLSAGAATTAVLMPGEERALAAIAADRPDAALARNLAAMRILREASPSLPLVGDYHLNAANEISAAALLAAGLSRVTACLDLDAGQVESLIGRISAERLEVPFRVRVPMFHTAHCLWAANYSKGQACAECGGNGSASNGSPPSGPCRRLPLRLRDRVGEEHLAAADAAGRGTIFASRPRVFYPAAGRLARAGAAWFRVELADENADETRQAVSEAARALAAK
jgi:U32 family peptidase